MRFCSLPLSGGWWSVDEVHQSGNDVVAFSLVYDVGPGLLSLNRRRCKTAWSWRNFYLPCVTPTLWKELFTVWIPWTLVYVAFLNKLFEMFVDDRRIWTDLIVVSEWTENWLLVRKYILLHLVRMHWQFRHIFTSLRFGNTRELICTLKRHHSWVIVRDLGITVEIGWQAFGSHFRSVVYPFKTRHFHPVHVPLRISVHTRGT